MSDEGRLGAADPAAAGDGPRSGFGRHFYGTGDPSGAELTEAQKAYKREWEGKGYRVTYIPKQLGHAATPYVDSGPVQAESADTADIWEGDYFEESVVRVFDQLEKVLLSKHADYGPTNISAAPGGALNGLRVRIHDKVARINHLLDKGTGPEHESLEDSFLDLCNYSVIAVLVLRNQWPS